jgi:hypothetical protein
VRRSHGFRRPGSQRWKPYGRAQECLCSGRLRERALAPAMSKCMALKMAVNAGRLVNPPRSLASRLAAVHRASGAEILVAMLLIKAPCLAVRMWSREMSGREMRRKRGTVCRVQANPLPRGRCSAASAGHVPESARRTGSYGQLMSRSLHGARQASFDTRARQARLRASVMNLQPTCVRSARRLEQTVRVSCSGAGVGQPFAHPCQPPLAALTMYETMQPKQRRSLFLHAGRRRLLHSSTADQSGWSIVPSRVSHAILQGHLVCALRRQPRMLRHLPLPR